MTESFVSDVSLFQLEGLIFELTVKHGCLFFNLMFECVIFLSKLSVLICDRVDHFLVFLNFIEDGEIFLRKVFNHFFVELKSLFHLIELVFQLFFSAFFILQLHL